MPFHRRPSQASVSSSSHGGHGHASSARQTDDLDNFVNLGLLAPAQSHKSKWKTLSSSTHDSHRHRHGGSTDTHARQPSLRGPKHTNSISRSTAHTFAPSSQYAARPGSQQSRSAPAFQEDDIGTMIDVTGPRSRRERTFIGSECAVCEEPLEHTLRGERILQLSCSHVAHEACFYEYIKEFECQECPTCDAPLGIDTSRGGNLNFEKLNTAIRNVQTPDIRQRDREREREREHERNRDTVQTAIPWELEAPHQETRSVRSQQTHQTHQTHSTHQTQPLPQLQQAHYTHQPQETQQTHQAHQSNPLHQTQPTHQTRPSQQTLLSQESPRVQANQSRSRERSQKFSVDSRQHSRNGSGATGGGHSSADFAESQALGRRHDFDVQSMESSVTPRALPKNPIPAPIVTVRSEFPTLNRSRQQQSLTCLVTVEVVDGNWRPDPEDIRSPPPMFSPNLSDSQSRPRSPDHPPRIDIPREHPDVLAKVAETLRTKVDNWHGLDFARFGKLILYGTIRVGKDRQSWQDLECYLFTEMLICIKEKKGTPQTPQQSWNSSPDAQRVKSKCTLKGSILIKRHLKQVEFTPELDILTLSLSVAELPQFHLQFHDKTQMDIWRRALLHIDQIDTDSDEDPYNSGVEDDDALTTTSKGGRRMSSSVHSSYGASRSNYTAPTDYTSSRTRSRPPPPLRLPMSMHVPLDVVVVVPISTSMQGLKISLLRDVLRFMVAHLGEQDRMGLVTFGSNGGSMPIVGMTSKAWNGWSKVLETIKPIGQKSLRADVVDGANVAMDLLMQRKSANPLSSIMLISDSATSDTESVDFVVSRAEAAKIAIHSFGLGLTHKPDTMIELSTRTKATYTYVKDWMMLRECVAGCLGSMQSVSHQNAKLKLRLPEGSPAKFVKISGALQITKRATGRDAEASLGDLRFGDKRDILVQLAITADSATPEQLPQDPWENIISGLEALGGPLDQEDMRTISIEEVPLIQADLLWGDILREGNVTQLPRPSLLAITMLPSVSRKASSSSLTRPSSPPIPPHPSIVQRRMELLTSDMLTRALTLVSKGQHERACHLLTETRTILKGLGKGGLPPLPPPPSARLPPTPSIGSERSPMNDSPRIGPVPIEARRTPSPPRAEPLTPFTPAAGIDAVTMTALDAELESSLEWINHPAVFGRDSRKAVLQAIGVISSQRGFTLRTSSEALWAKRIPGVKRLTDRSREWREAGDDMLTEEA